MSETGIIREIAKKYCIGKGVDLGCGGDKITPETWGFDMPRPYTKVGDDSIEIKGDARALPFNDGVLDYVYSSHLLEDFPNTGEVLKEWVRVLKPDGLLILYLPDEQIYRKHCQETGQGYNKAHSVENMNLEFIVQELSKLGSFKVVESISIHATYSFFLVVRK